MLKDDFPQIWVPSWENRDLRQLLWHRRRMVQARTRMMNQLQAVALNEGLRCKEKLWREAGREQLEGFQLAAPSETSCQAVFGEMCGYTTTFSLGQRASSLRCRLRFCHSGL